MALSDSVIGQTIESVLVNGKFKITKLALNGSIGAQGEVYEDEANPKYLLKVWHKEPQDFDLARRMVKNRYKTFVCLQLKERELACLPREYVEVAGRPAYLMERAVGLQMKDAWESLVQLDLLSRLRIAYSLAQGVSILHGRSMVHADIKPANLFFDPATHQVQILDVDGGGYWGTERKTEQFQPSAVVIPRYMAPELRRVLDRSDLWGPIWRDARRRKQPDLWSLAVLLYEIIVDEDGPFFRGYFKKAAAAYSDHPEWPHQEQRKKIEQLGIDKELVTHFTDVFCARNRTRFDYRRVEASGWMNTLRRVIKRRQSKQIEQSPWFDLLSECPKHSVSVNTIDFGSARYGKMVVEVSNSGSTPLDVLITGIPSWLVVAPVGFRCQPRETRSTTLTLLREGIPGGTLTESEQPDEQLSCRLDVFAAVPTKSNGSSVFLTVKVTVAQSIVASKSDIVKQSPVQKPKLWRRTWLIVVMFLGVFIELAKKATLRI